MKFRLSASVLFLLLFSTAPSYAQGAATSDGQQAALDAPVVQPPSAPPLGVPPPAPQQVPAPPQAPPLATSGQVQPPAPSAGQWVYTTQYGWLWMAYGAQYTSSPVNGAVPSTYVYSPSAGWTWLAAPWVLGWGPSPYFGMYAPARFAWYRPGFSGYGYPAASGYRPPNAAYHPAVGFSRAAPAAGFHAGYAVRAPGRR